MAVLLHFVSSKWYHFVGNFMYNFFYWSIFLQMCIFEAQNGEKQQESVFVPHLRAPFGHLLEVGSKSYRNFRIQSVRINRKIMVTKMLPEMHLVPKKMCFIKKDD